MKYVKLKTLSLKNHSDLNERWLQEKIAEDPSVLKLGDVIVKDKERRQAGAGRLDMLLQELEGYGRYEVEIQLGATDESHIIRTIEYWDIEKKRYPQYEHVAVIIAEDITSRFFNVISLFNGFIPLIAIQVAAIETAEGVVGLQFTKVLDTVRLGYLDDDEVVAETTDRDYWENVKKTKQALALADQISVIVKRIHSNTGLNYNKHYIGFLVDGRVRNFLIIRPRKNGIRLEVRLSKNDDVDEIIDNAELDLIDYIVLKKRYCIKLSKKDFENKKKKEVIIDLMERAFNAYP